MNLADLNDLLTELETWADRWEGALCSQTDPDMWTPDKGGLRNEVKATCRRCPLVDQCLQYALDRRLVAHDSGVWGATTPKERLRMVQLMEKAA